jgi:hypothetical protein
MPAYMKKKSIYRIFVFSLFVTLLACGGWPDNIKLSVRSAEFGPDGDSLTVTTKGSGWWLTDIKADNIHYDNFDGIDVHTDSYSIKQDYINFERRDRKTIFIRLDPNATINVRTVIFELEDGDYFDRITITQKGRKNK